MSSTVTPSPAPVLEQNHRVPEEVWDHLAEAEWARIGFTTYAGIQIIPVRYVLDAHALVFSSPAAGVLAQLGDLTCTVACEVDRQDPDASPAWHVLMHGRITRQVTTGSPGPTVALRFVPDTVGGRRVDVELDQA